MLLSCKDLSVEGDHGVVVSGATFQIRAGEIVLLTGPNGSGKSLLLEALAGRRQPIAGTIRTAGGTASPVLATTADLCEAMGSTSAGWVASFSDRSQTAVDEALRSASLPWDRPIGRLSAGERQRLVLAATSIARGPALLLDSPTAHLDSLGYDFAELVIRSRSSLGAAVLIATTDPEMVVRFGESALLKLERSEVKVLRGGAR